MGFKDTPAIVADPKTPLRPIIKAAAKPGNGLNPGSQTPARNPNTLTPTPGIWSNGGTNTLKSGLAAARAPSQAPFRAPRPKSVMMRANATPSALASGMNNLNLANASTKNLQPFHRPHQIHHDHNPLPHHHRSQSSLQHALSPRRSLY
jgi:hypothetical protein